MCLDYPQHENNNDRGCGQTPDERVTKPPRESKQPTTQPNFEQLARQYRAAKQQTVHATSSAESEVEHAFRELLLRIESDWTKSRVTFELARFVKGLSLNTFETEQFALRLFNHQNYRDGTTFDDFLEEFSNGKLQSVKYPHGKKFMEFAEKEAQKRICSGKLSEVALMFDSPDYRKIVTLCEILQYMQLSMNQEVSGETPPKLRNPEAPFFLSARTAAEFLGKKDDIKKANRILIALQTRFFNGHPVLLRLYRGSGKKASRFIMRHVVAKFVPLRDSPNSTNAVFAELSEANQKTLLLIFWYEHLRRRTGQNQEGYRAFIQITRQIVVDPLFKMFSTVRAWLEENKLPVSVVNHSWRFYLERVFFRFQGDTPNYPEPGQLKNDTWMKYWHEQPIYHQNQGLNPEVRKAEMEIKLGPLYAALLGVDAKTALRILSFDDS